MMEPITLSQLLADPARENPAIIDEASEITVSYRVLAEQVEHTAQVLHHAGLQPGAAVVLVLPNGAELLIMCLALARAGLIAAPLNPAYKAGEIRGLITDVDARAIVTFEGNAVVAAAAAGLAVPIWSSSIDSAGVVRLTGLPTAPSGTLAEPGPEDVALFLHTSGTDGPAKVVPLTHANIVLSARHIAAHYALTSEDRTLVVLPLFHGHGLIGAALSTLASGGTAIVAPRFSGSHFWESFRKYRATWFTAVPTIHEILLERAERDGAPPQGVRFIRSCSAPLAPAMLERLERRFAAPVVEAYGMTEATHQVASNPLPPRARKPGTVGFGTGVQVAVIDAEGRHLPPFAAGEVVVRGPTVMHGYHNNPAANSAAFVGGWLRTGDIGKLDEEGYLTLVGRFKEMINRGGEKISPTEIEAVLLEHPAVAQAAAFGVPDPKYGEVVEAAVVLKDKADSEVLCSFCRERLVNFKVPTVIWTVPSLPRNAMGKVQREALVRRYGVAERG